MSKLTVRDLSVTGRRVLVRVDFNVPLDGERVTDDTRIRETLPTLRLLIEQNARIVLCSHLGRPKGKIDPRFSLRPVSERLRQLLAEALGRPVPVVFCPVTVGPEAEKMAADLPTGGVLLVENLRFQAEEEANDAGFAAQLARLGEIYVNDAFGSAHRAHASTAGVTRHLPQSAAGLLMEKELQYMGQAVHGAEHPYVVILGGAKIADKIPVIESLGRSADVFLIGGGMAYTFLAAQGQPIGDSLFEPDRLEVAKRVLADAAAGKFRLLLPTDHVVAKTLAVGVPTETVATIGAGQKAFDIGPETRAAYTAEIARAKLIVWNGPMGVFEIPPFDAGTVTIARAVGAAKATSIVGGGDSVAAVHAAGEAARITHISTGGGASLEFLGGQTLPGVAALSEQPAGARG